jgi:hypothetical protein
VKYGDERRTVLCGGAVLGQHRHIALSSTTSTCGIDVEQAPYCVLIKAIVAQVSVLAAPQLEEVLQPGPASGCPLARFASRVETALVDKAGVGADGGTRTRTPFQGADFRTTSAFAAARNRAFVVWTIPSP